MQELEENENIPPPNRQNEDVRPADRVDYGIVRPNLSGGKRLPFSSTEFCSGNNKTSLNQAFESNLTTETESVSQYVDKDFILNSGSSVKRVYTEVDRSPEQDEIQAKKSTAEYSRCFPIPETQARAHTGLTGIFSTVTLESHRVIPNQSSPANVAKNLLCELDEPGETGGTGASSSFTLSPRHESDLKRSLSLDSDISGHDMSIVIKTPPSLGTKNGSKEASLSEDDNIVVEAPAPTALPIHHKENQSRESDCSVVDHFHLASSSLLKSPSFLKPKNVVAFRSYCSSINRSNMSYGSRLSLASMDGTDIATSSFHHNLPTAVTPVQKKRPSLSSSLYQVKHSMLANVFIVGLDTSLFDNCILDVEDLIL